MSVVASWPTVVVVAALGAGLAGACQGPDPFARRLVADGGSPDTTTFVGTAGTQGKDGDGNGVKVSYTCRDELTAPTQRSFIVDITNESPASIPLEKLTLRYWYTIGVGEQNDQALDCDTAKIGCTNVVTSANGAPNFVTVMPPKDGATAYAEIAFTPGALALDPALDTGEIQLRIHNKTFTPVDQQLDYSLDCAMMGNAVDNPHITAYVDGVLEWGVEPGKPKVDGGT